MSRWTVGSALVVVAALSMLLIGQARAEPVTVTVTPSGIAITINPNSVAFTTVEVGETVATPDDGTPPTVDNAGGVTIGVLTMTYSGSSGTEATCAGEGTWAANSSTTAEDQFVMRAAIDLGFAVIDPTTGTGDLLSVPLTTVASAIDLDVELQMPTAFTTTGVCSIGLTVTASA